MNIYARYRDNLKGNTSLQSCDVQDQVYVFYNPQNGLYKIGITGDWMRRKQAIISAVGHDLHTILVIHLEEDYDEPAKHLESFLHEMFASKRARGEWFALSIYDIYRIKILFWDVVVGEHIEDYTPNSWS